MKKKMMIQLVKISSNINLINKLYFNNKEILIGGLFTNSLFFPDDSGGNIFSVNKNLQDEKTENLFSFFKNKKNLFK